MLKVHLSNLIVQLSACVCACACACVPVRACAWMLCMCVMRLLGFMYKLSAHIGQNIIVRLFRRYCNDSTLNVCVCVYVSGHDH